MYLYNRNTFHSENRNKNNERKQTMGWLRGHCAALPNNYSSRVILKTKAKNGTLYRRYLQAAALHNNALNKKTLIVLYVYALFVLYSTFNTYWFYFILNIFRKATLNSLQHFREN